VLALLVPLVNLVVRIVWCFRLVRARGKAPIWVPLLLLPVTVREPGTISHNLRTVVVTPCGQIHHVFRDNEWQPSDLVAKLREADPGPITASMNPPGARARMKITGMSCEGCAQAIQTALGRETGVHNAVVS